ncbi:hypothetical protein [Streptomyces zaomyceticus]|uniref:hypothetical protein n=1 Tax=Streptomyces zaomyceticus TaxID=68286 RepID=UPI0036AA0B06
MNPREHVAEEAVAWLRAQDGASRLLLFSGAWWPTESFEHHAVHDVLALTLLLGTGVSPVPDSMEELDRLRELMAYDVEWAVWCQRSLDSGASDLSCADRVRAKGAFRWLVDSRLVGGSLISGLEGAEIAAPYRGAGVSVGVALAQHVLDLWANRFRCEPGAV